MNNHHRTLPDRFIWLSDPHWYPGCPHEKRLAGIVEDAFPNPTFFGGDSLEAHAGVKYKDRPDWFDPKRAVKGNHDDDILPTTIPDAIYDKKKRTPAAWAPIPQEGSSRIWSDNYGSKYVYTKLKSTFVAT